MTPRQTRRSDRPLTSQEVLDAVLFHPVEWPWKTTRYERDSLPDYLQRQLSTAVPVTELCHESTKLSPTGVGDLTASRVDVTSLRLDYVYRRAFTSWKTGPPVTEVDRRVRAVTEALYVTSSPDLYYAVELRVAVGPLVYWHEPLAGTMHVVKELSADDRAVLRQALTAMPGAPRIRTDPYLFLVGSFARNELLFGNRGHRRTLLEAGQLMQALIGAGRLVGQPIIPVYDFTDRDVDAVLQVDGVEEATLAVLGLSGGNGAG